MLELAGQERSAPDRARKAVESLAGMRALPFRYFTDNPAAAGLSVKYRKGRARIPASDSTALRARSGALRSWPASSSIRRRSGTSFDQPGRQL